MRAPYDPELDAIFDDPDLLEIANLLRAAPQEQFPADPAFRSALRRRLTDEAWRAARPRRRWWRLGTGPAFAWSAAGVGVLLIAFVAYTLAVNPFGRDTTVYWNSPLQDAQAVATVQPIVLDFSQPMDAESVQQSVQIQPATTATYAWQGNSLTITPVNRLAPDTEYTVKVAAGAKTRSGSALPVQPAVTFVTAPLPAATPSPSPSASPSAAPPSIAGERQVGAAGDQPPAWVPDGSALLIVGPGGVLASYPAAGGAGTVLVADGVTLATAGPDGRPAYARAGQVLYGQQAVGAANPLAIGFDGAGRLEVATARQALTAGGRTVTFAEDAGAAAFDAGGAVVAYTGASGLHLVTLSTGKDLLVGGATGIGAWAPAGDRLAFLSAGGLEVTDLAGRVAQVGGTAGAKGASWSPAGDLLVAGADRVFWVPAGGGAPVVVGTGTYGSPAWSPAGGSFSFRRGTGVFIATLSGLASASPLSSDQVVAGFMRARLKGDAAAAGAFLDAGGRAAFGRIPLLYAGAGGPQLERYHVLLLQPARAAVRLYLTQGSAQTAVDETLTLVGDGAGRVLVDGAADSAPAPAAAGPTVLGVRVAAAQVSVTFDSDLDPSTVAGVTLTGLTASATYDAPSRTVVLAVPAGLAPGADYTVAVAPSVKDVNGEPAPVFSLSITGPAS